MSLVSSTPLPIVLFSAFAFLAVTGCGAGLPFGDGVQRTERTTVDPLGVTSLVIMTDNGNIDVIAGTGDIEVTALINEPDPGDVAYAVEVVDGELTITATCDGGWFDSCEVAFQVVAPAGIDVTIETDNGDLLLAGAAGRLDATTDNGDIDGRALDSRSVRLTTDNGDIDLAFHMAPDRVTAYSDNGTVLVELPSIDGAYAVDAASDNGDVRVDVANDPAARRTVAASSDNGAVTVRYPSD